MHEKWVMNIPDELPPNLLELVGNDAAVRDEIAKLHASLKQKIEANRNRKKFLFEKHGIMLRNENDIAVRVNLLTEMFIGILAPERLRYELRWQEVIAESLEEAYAGLMEEKKRQNGARDLHLPGGRIHTVFTEKGESDGPAEEPDPQG